MLNLKKMPVLLVALAILSMVAIGACCENPNATQQISQTMYLVQAAYYDVSGDLQPQIKEMTKYNSKVALGVTIADTALALAGQLQSQYCPKAADVEQLKLQAQAAQQTLEQTAPGK